MSSSTLPNTPSAADRARMVEAVVRVAETSLFAVAEPLAADAPVPPVEARWDVAVVRFRGPFSGTMSLAVPDPLARELCEMFLGEDPGPDPEGAISDFSGEVANMSCGAWLTMLDVDGCFDLTHPDVTRQDAPPERRDAVIMINDWPVTVALHLDGAEP
jgi:hypothetical protein